MKTYVVTPHWNRLGEMVLMMVAKYVLWRNMANYSQIIPVTSSYLKHSIFYGRLNQDPIAAIVVLTKSKLQRSIKCAVYCILYFFCYKAESFPSKTVLKI